MITRATLKKYRNLGIAVVLLLISVLFHWELKITADLRVLPRQEAVVRAETAGTIAEVLVREGSQVKKGEVIARLYDFDKERALSLVTGELGQQRAALALLRAGPRAEEVDRAEKLVATKRVELSNVRRNIQYRNQLGQTLARRRTELELAEIEFRRTRDMFEQDVGPRIDMEKAETTVEIYRNAVGETEASIQMLAEQNDREEDLKDRELAEAESALTLLRAGFRIEDIQQRAAEVAMLEEQQRILEKELAKADIRAPITGTVVTPFVQRILNQRLVAGDEVCRIVDMDTVQIEMMVPEKEMADVKPAYPILMKVRAYPTDEFEGRVDFIAPVAETVFNQRFIKIRTEISNEDGMLKPEMTGVAKIHAGQRRIISLMTRRIIRWVRIEYWDLLP